MSIKFPAPLHNSSFKINNYCPSTKRVFIDAFMPVHLAICVEPKLGAIDIKSIDTSVVEDVHTKMLDDNNENGQYMSARQHSVVDLANEVQTEMLLGYNLTSKEIMPICTMGVFVKFSAIATLESVREYLGYIDTSYKFAYKSESYHLWEQFRDDLANFILGADKDEKVAVVKVSKDTVTEQ